MRHVKHHSQVCLINLYVHLACTNCRFLGHFQPQEGKPALWELDSDQHFHVGRLADEYSRYEVLPLKFVTFCYLVPWSPEQDVIGKRKEKDSLAFCM